MMIHKGEKPFECNICQKKFREKSNYNFHMKKHFPKNNKNSSTKNFEVNLKNKLKKEFDINDLNIDKKIHDFYIKVLNEGEKSFDNNSTNTNSNENTINNNSIIENKNDFQNKEVILNSEKYINNNPKVYNDLNINYFKFNSQLEKVIMNRNEICNNFNYQNENISLFNEQKDLNDFFNMNNGQNKYKNLNDANNNINYYDDLYIKDIFNLNKLGIMLQNDKIEFEMKNKIFDDYYYQDFPLNF